MTTKLENVPDGAGAAGIAAFGMAQKLMLYLIESKLLTAEHAVGMLRDQIETHQTVMDETGAGRNETVAHILRKFEGMIQTKFLSPK
jgi:hypothetical protein